MFLLKRGKTVFVCLLHSEFICKSPKTLIRLTQRPHCNWTIDLFVFPPTSRSLTFSTVPGLSLSNRRHSTAPSCKAVWRKASGSEIVFFGDSKTPSVMSHVTVCSAEFMSGSLTKHKQKIRCITMRSVRNETDQWDWARVDGSHWHAGVDQSLKNRLVVEMKCLVVPAGSFVSQLQPLIVDLIVEHCSHPPPADVYITFT